MKGTPGPCSARARRPSGLQASSGRGARRGLESARPGDGDGLRTSLHVSARLHVSPHVSAYLHMSPHVSTRLYTSPRVSARLHMSLHISTCLHTSPHVSTRLRTSPHAGALFCPLVGPLEPPRCPCLPTFPLRSTCTLSGCPVRPRGDVSRSPPPPELFTRLPEEWALGLPHSAVGPGGRPEWRGPQPPTERVRGRPSAAAADLRRSGVRTSALFVKGADRSSLSFPGPVLRVPWA